VNNIRELLQTESWTVRGSNPCEGEIFRARPDRPIHAPIRWIPGLFPRGKAAGVWRLLPTPSSAKVKERVEPPLFPSLGLRGLF